MSADQPIMGQLHCTCPEEALMTVSCDGSCHAYAASRAESIRWETSQAQTGSANRRKQDQMDQMDQDLRDFLIPQLGKTLLCRYAKLCQAALKVAAVSRSSSAVNLAFRVNLWNRVKSTVHWPLRDKSSYTIPHSPS